MAGIVERFQEGFKLTDNEWWEKNELNNFLKGYSFPAPKSMEFHPNTVERVRRGIGYIVYPQRMRKDMSDIRN